MRQNQQNGKGRGSEGNFQLPYARLRWGVGGRMRADHDDGKGWPAQLLRHKLARHQASHTAVSVNRTVPADFLPCPLRALIRPLAASCLGSVHEPLGNFAVFFGQLCTLHGDEGGQHS